MECSSRTGEGVKEVFEQITRVALTMDESMSKPHKLTPFQKLSAFISKSGKGKQRANFDKPPSESVLGASRSNL
jgi:hypothetical protein